MIGIYMHLHAFTCNLHAFTNLNHINWEKLVNVMYGIFNSNSWNKELVKIM